VGEALIFAPGARSNLIHVEMKKGIYQKRAKLIKNIEVTKKYYKIVLSCPLVARRAHPGQFLQIKVKDGDRPLLRRPFSIHRIASSHPRAKGYDLIEVLYEVLGEGTQILSRKKPGENLDIIGPLGCGFDYRLPVTSYKMPVLIAGGMGAAPLFFLAEQLKRHSALVLIGARTESDILCEKEFKRLGCEVKIATDNGSKGHKGKVTDLLKKILRDTKYSIHRPMYACGPHPMLKEISRISSAHKIPAQVSLEEHMACGIGGCFGCAVNTKDGFKRVCKEGPVFNSEEIVWE